VLQWLNAGTLEGGKGRHWQKEGDETF
jgi:hypothetical protein